MKRTQNLIAGLDIGSTTVRMAVGQLVPRNNGSNALELQILGAAESSSEGVHKGTISSIEDAVSSVSECLEKTERMVGVPVDSAWVGVSGMQILSQKSKGVVAVSKADNEISDEDVARALEAARVISTPLNYEVLHVLPRSFSVDGQAGIKDPVGMTSMRLEVDTQIIMVSSSQVKNLTKTVYRTGLEIDDLALSVIVTAEAVLTGRQKELGVAVVDVGGSTTSLAVFEGGDLIHLAIIPIGSENITNDVAIGLRTSIEVAERVKREFGHCLPEAVNKKDEIDLGELGAPQHELVKKYFLGEIIEARVDEIMQKINQELNRVQRSGLLPAGAVFVGGGAKLAGFVDVARRGLRLPATLGYPLNISSITEKVNDLGFVPAVSLVKWGADASRGGYVPKSKGIIGGGLKAGAAMGQLKKLFKTLIP